MGRERAVLDRRLGEGLLLFRDRRFDTMDIGYRSFGDLAFNELGLSPSRAYELASFAEGLERYPALARAFHSGRLGRSKIELLLQVIEPDMVEGWIGLAAEMPAGVLRKVVRGYLRRVKGRFPEEKADDYERIDIDCPDWVWQFFKTEGRELAEAVCGKVLALWEVMEIFCAEFLSEFGAAAAGEGDQPAEEETIALPTEEALRQTSGIPVQEDETDPMPAMDLPDPALAGDAWQLLEILQALTTRRQSLDWRLGGELDRLGRLRIPVHVDGALGRSPRWARGLVSLHRKLEGLPAVRDDYREGRIGWTKAGLIAQIAGPETEKAWLARARKIAYRTFKIDVDAMVGLRNLNPEKWRERTKGLPPDDALRKEMEMQAGACRPVPLEVLKRVADIRNPEDRWKQPDNRPGAGGKAPNGLWAPPSAAETIRRAIRRARELLGIEDEGVVVSFLVEYYRQQYGKQAEKARVCAVAGCSRRGEHKHHIVYRSHGGGDEPGNVAWLCVAHHLAGEHGGRIQIRGRAPGEVYILVGKRIWKGDELIAVLDEEKNDNDDDRPQ